MAENDRPRAAAKVAKPKKPLGPMKMYAVYKGQLEKLELVRNKRNIVDLMLTDRDLQVKEFTFDRIARDA